MRKATDFNAEMAQEVDQIREGHITQPHQKYKVVGDRPAEPALTGRKLQKAKFAATILAGIYSGFRPGDTDRCLELAMQDAESIIKECE